MTLALSLRKWGGGAGIGFPPPFTLRAGWRLELECQSLDGGGRGRKLRARPGRSERSPRLAHSPTPPIPFPFPGTRRPTGQICQHPWAALAERSEPGTVGEGRSQKACRPRQSGRALLHAGHVGPISHAGLAARRSR